MIATERGDRAVPAWDVCGRRDAASSRAIEIVQGVLATSLLVASTLIGVPWRCAGAVEHFDNPTVAFINEKVATGWEERDLKPAKPATDGEWCRRVHLDLIGRIPTIEELQSYVGDSTPMKRAVLVGRLLGDDYVDEYARHWTDVWTTVLIGRDVENERVSRPGMRQWLRRALSRNMPYDQFMEELVTATGVNTNRRDVDGFNGATNFLSGKMEEMGVANGVQATAKTAQIFLGVQVQCTQCHNHPFNKGKQNQFWELNAFFRQAQALRRFDGTRDVRWIELVDGDFPGEGRDPQEAEIYYELRNGLMKVAYPVFIDGTEISRSGYLPAVLEDGTAYGVNRRAELAKLIKTSPNFPRAIVNRIWAQFFGYGFTRPVDDFGDHNPPSHPELLDGLAERLQESSFDLKELMRWITLSEAYALSSRTTAGNAKDDPLMGEKPMFSRFYMRQMQAEQLYESLLTATQADRSRTGEDAAKAKDEWLSQFIIAFGTDEGDDATMFNGSIPQVLMMFNGDLVKAATAIGKGGFLEAIATGGLRDEAKLAKLYEAALARGPTPKELTAAKKLVAGRRGDVAGALQDIWWAVLNSNEFILNH
ncbi:MAG: DUF1549 and DUF1553 domain-containing protein [Planctomycetaceae bacterium]